MKRSPSIRPADGRLAVLLPGLGAVATTLIAGVSLVRRGLASPVGSFTQLGTIRLSEDPEGREARIRDFAPLAAIDALELGGWDIFPDDAYAAAEHAGVLSREHLHAVREELSAVKPMPGAFYPGFVRRLHGTHVKTATSKADMVEQIRGDVRRFLEERRCSRAVAVWCASTEVYARPQAVHSSIVAFERGLERSDPAITNSQLYAWAFLQERVPFADGSPNSAIDFPAAVELARENRVAVAGKDFKSGQTLLKTVVAPGLRSRSLGVRGWYSTNILGNRDGEVLDDPDSARAKEESKLGVLETILDRAAPGDLYADVVHKVRIDYFPPRGDDKEAWDSVDLFGWLGYPMQLKVNFLCKDSILAAPLALDLALLLDLAQRAGLHGVQEWLGFFFKSPVHAPGRPATHDLFAQRDALHRALRAIVREGDGGEADSPSGAAIAG